jgi:hypothetical protein
MPRYALVAGLAFVLAAAPSTQSPYAGQQLRDVKSLDPAVLRALQRGEGNGMALVGELNHYPGPRHVLAMASHLGLTVPQKAATEAIYSKMHDAAVTLGMRIIEKERDLDRAFRDGSITDDSLKQITTDIAMLNGQLRAVHLSAHLAMKAVLTSEQIKMYDSMRGYGSDMTNMQH